MFLCVCLRVCVCAFVVCVLSLFCFAFVLGGVLSMRVCFVMFVVVCVFVVGL